MGPNMQTVHQRTQGRLSRVVPPLPLQEELTPPDTRLLPESEKVDYTTRAAGRITVDRYYEESAFTKGFAFIAPQDAFDWKLQLFNEEVLAKKSAVDLMQILVDASPDVDRALHDMYLFIVQGITLTSPDASAQAILDDAVATMKMRGESLFSKMRRCVAAGFIGGAIYAENVFELNARDFYDIKIVDPFQARYEKVDDAVGGQGWLLCKEEYGRCIPIHPDPTVIYEPLNPMPGRPFGRPLANSAIFAIIFLIGLLKSARQVVETQAWPRGMWRIDRKNLHDAGIQTEADIQRIIEQNQALIAQYMKRATKSTQPIMGAEVSYEVIGAMGRHNLGAVEMLEKVLERWIVRGLKQYPILFGISGENALSTDANVQLEAHSIFVESFQETLEDIFTTFFTQILRARGNHGKVNFQLKRNNSLVRLHRSEILKNETESIRELQKEGTINAIEARRILRTKVSEWFGELPEKYQPDAPMLLKPTDTDSETETSEPTDAVA